MSEKIKVRLTLQFLPSKAREKPSVQEQWNEPGVFSHRSFSPTHLAPSELALYPGLQEMVFCWQEKDPTVLMQLKPELHKSLRLRHSLMIEKCKLQHCCFNLRTLPPLKNLCETFLQERDQRSPEAICSLHSEKLRLFCLDHQQPVCVVCRDSKTHTNHRFRPMAEAAQDLREELQKSLQPFQEKLKLFEEVKVKFDQTAGHMKVQAQHTETQIKEQFKKLHQFLEEEEEARMAALREEEEQKRRMMEEKMEAVSREIAALSHTVRATEEELELKTSPSCTTTRLQWRGYSAPCWRIHSCPQEL
ncbi:hypothetical protein F7725_016426 [Dissostichus mawsoni]|uniref:B box-type domain-containing protein n=1 Tax=Dissostichus mawsoni TaxID=36200 RepID=A0A7J5Z2H6_DISMA|nr:hypothetical protein F7725_016426 [Dissostichus mawsoni]